MKKFKMILFVIIQIGGLILMVKSIFDHSDITFIKGLLITFWGTYLSDQESNLR